MISPYGVKANMVCASCEYCKNQRVPAPIYWRNKCLKNNKWLTDTSSFCNSYKMGKFFVERGYQEIKTIVQNRINLKSFKDLVFIPHPIAREAQGLPLCVAKEYAKAKQAKMDFENGYGISVLFGSMFYSNGIDSYEVGVLKGGTLCYDTPITNDVIGYIPAAEVSDIMRKIQELPID